MKHIKITAFIVLAFFSVSASCDERKGNVQEQQEGTLPPVETQPPNTRYKPAFEGQTRIAGVKTSTPYRATVISSSLSSPWAVTPLPDGRLVITERVAPCASPLPMVQSATRLPVFPKWTTDSREDFWM